MPIVNNFRVMDFEPDAAKRNEGSKRDHRSSKRKSMHAYLCTNLLKYTSKGNNLKRKKIIIAVAIINYTKW